MFFFYQLSFLLLILSRFLNQLVKLSNSHQFKVIVTNFDDRTETYFFYLTYFLLFFWAGANIQQTKTKRKILLGKCLILIGKTK